MIFKVTQEESEKLDISQPGCSTQNNSTHSTTPRKRARIATVRSKSEFLSKERAKIITRALTKLVAFNKLPYNFTSSPAFKKFMKELEQNYDCSLTTPSYV